MHNVSGEMGLECIESMARQFYGYGCWNAPYCFLGPEPGMAKKDMARKADDLEKRCAAWQRLGGGELLDCIEHHRAFGLLRWHAAPSEPQRTWKRLMPTFILMYGTGQWKRIAEASFDTEGVCPIGQTVAMVTLYPTAPIRANTDEKWLEFGRRLRRRCETRGRS